MTSGSMTSSLLSLLLAVGFAATGAACAQTPPDKSGAAVDDGIEIQQGATAAYGAVTIGFLNLFEDGDVRISIWRDADPTTLEQLSLRRGEVIGADGRFLRLGEVDPAGGAQRARVVLEPLSDAGGLLPPGADSTTLYQNAELEFSGMRMRVDGGIAAEHARIEAWPKPHPRENVADADVTTYTAAPGAMLQVGGKTLQVIRLQPPAGEVLGFVELQTRP